MKIVRIAACSIALLACNVALAAEDAVASARAAFAKAGEAVAKADQACGKNHYILDDTDECAWILTSPLIESRWMHTATLLSDGSVLVAGGSLTGARPERRTAEIFSPLSGKWTRTGSMNVERARHQAALLPDGRVLVVGGDHTDLHPAWSLGYVGTAEIYDPATRSWTLTGSLNFPRGEFTMSRLGNGKVLVAGGVDDADLSLAACEVYDPATGLWTPTGSLEQGRFSHTATVLNDGSVLVAAGVLDDWNGVTLASAEIYDPVTGTWTATGALNADRSHHTATLLNDGSVLVTGGYWRRAPGPPGGFYEESPRADAEIYDPVARKWSVTALLPSPRFGHTATLRDDGTVLSVGGIVSLGRIPALTYTSVAGSALFSRAAAGWRNAGNPQRLRLGHTATRLNNGWVLIVGGQGFDGTRFSEPLNSAEMYR